MATFRDWLVREGRDIFGFERRSHREAPVKKACDKPITDISSDIVAEMIMSRDVDGVKPVSEFSNQIRWGEGTGAVKMVVTPLGSYKSIIRRMQPDLEGHDVWVCKKVLPYKEILEANQVVDEDLAWLILGQVEAVRRQDIEAPSHDYSGLGSLIRKAARTLQRRDIQPEIFLYRGIREVKQGLNYLIVFEVRGQGVEAPGSSRVEQFLVDISYNPSTGMIRSFGHDVQSPTRGHVWYPQPSEWDEYFSSGQKEDEIVECMAAALYTY